MKKKPTPKPKKKDNKPKDLGGRPTDLNNSLVNKLVDAFKRGASIGMACKQAGISRQTYYNRYENDVKFFDKILVADPDSPTGSREIIKEYSFKEEVDLAREFPNQICRRVVIQAAAWGEWRAGMEFLKNTDPEFKRRHEHDVTTTEKPPINEEDLIDD